MRKPVVFLDFDGVLNSVSWHREHPTPAFIPPTYARDAIAEERIDPACVRRLRRLIEEAGAEIVVSSSWRRRMPTDEVGRMFAHYGFPDAPVVGLTLQCGISSSHRGREVGAWLRDHRPDGGAYLCIDDSEDFYPQQPVLYTDPEVGLTDADVDAAVRMLTAQRARGDVKTSVEEALRIARASLSKLDAVEWPVYSDREGDAIWEGRMALLKIVALLEPYETPGSALTEDEKLTTLRHLRPPRRQL